MTDLPIASRCPDAEAEYITFVIADQPSLHANVYITLRPALPVDRT